KARIDHARLIARDRTHDACGEHARVARWYEPTEQAAAAVVGACARFECGFHGAWIHGHDANPFAREVGARDLRGHREARLRGAVVRTAAQRHAARHARNVDDQSGVALDHAA